ncbi:MAG: dihydrolipoamide acetyltransferase, partial [Candidatus Marinimicrobia bacterium]|nr:dihydrolipoamide acetyltransferase [Candidatus Neomarinimicrobiota bacterium]
MAFEIVMPKMGESIVEGTIIEWKKNIGDFVEKDEILLEISTDKVDSEIPSSHEGFLLEVYFQKNETVEVGKPIALIGGKNESVSSIRQEKVQKNNDLDSKNITLESKKNQDSSKSNEKEVKDDLIAKTEEGVRSHQTSKFYSPLVKSIARKEKIDLKELESLNGSGANGRINKVDILNYLDNKNKTKGTKINDSSYIDAENNSFSGDIEPIDHIRKSISDHMLKSIKTSAHVYSAVEVDVTSIVDYIDKNKDKFLENNGIKITYTPFFLEACIEAL